MSDDHKKPGMEYWATAALIVMLVAYSLSFGPACWLVSCDGRPRLGTARFYRPIERIRIL